MIRSVLHSRSWRGIIDFLLPRLCCGCGERVINSQGLACEQCLESIEPLRLPICLTCGCPDARIKSEGKCTNCPPGTTWFTSARGVAVFTGMAQTLVAKVKYQRRMEYAPLIASAMASEYMNRKDRPAELIVPVPLHPTRQRERGFNQSALLAKHLTEELQLPVLDNVLVREKPTTTQTRLKKGERRKNVAGAFACKELNMIRGQHVLLIDDVYTTGSTLNECARVLRQAGAASVECLAYARAVLQ